MRQHRLRLSGRFQISRCLHRHFRDLRTAWPDASNPSAVLKRHALWSGIGILRCLGPAASKKRDRLQAFLHGQRPSECLDSACIFPSVEPPKLLHEPWREISVRRRCRERWSPRIPLSSFCVVEHLAIVLVLRTRPLGHTCRSSEPSLVEPTFTIKRRRVARRSQSAKATTSRSAVGVSLSRIRWPVRRDRDHPSRGSARCCVAWRPVATRTSKMRLHHKRPRKDECASWLFRLQNLADGSHRGRRSFGSRWHGKSWRASKLLTSSQARCRALVSKLGAELSPGLPASERHTLPRPCYRTRAIGLLRPDRPSPTDAECEQILEDERLRKYA